MPPCQRAFAPLSRVCHRAFARSSLTRCCRMLAFFAYPGHGRAPRRRLLAGPRRGRPRGLRRLVRRADPSLDTTSVARAPVLRRRVVVVVVVAVAVLLFSSCSPGVGCGAARPSSGDTPKEDGRGASSGDAAAARRDGFSPRRRDESRRSPHARGAESPLPVFFPLSPPPVRRTRAAPHRTAPSLFTSRSLSRSARAGTGRTSTSSHGTSSPRPRATASSSSRTATAATIYRSWASRRVVSRAVFLDLLMKRPLSARAPSRAVFVLCCTLTQ